MFFVGSIVNITSARDLFSLLFIPREPGKDTNSLYQMSKVNILIFLQFDSF